MPDDTNERIEGLEPKELFRRALGEGSAATDAAERAAEAERLVRAEIEQRLPELELHELLGRGGMGYVFRARQRKLDREVALKVIAPMAERHADFAERFAREARTLARLEHPNIVAVYDYGEDGTFCWLMMEYVEGSNLRDVIRTGKLDPAEALALVPMICDALQFAHDRGIVHRDVKPENILLDVMGHVKIADFGLAKLLGSAAAIVNLTGSQQVLGTLRYMAPEQLDRPLAVDHRADIYSLGVVFYEMLTGEIPMGRFDPPSLHSTASRAVDDVVLRALAKEPDRRYQQASEVKSDLGSMASGESSEPRAADSDPTAGETGPKLAGSAALSAALFGTGSIPYGIMVLIFLSARANAGWFQPSFMMFIGLLFGTLGLTLMIVGCVVGFRALDRIRAAWPRLYGVGAAVTGSWGGVLLIANGVLLGIVLGSQHGLIYVPLTPFVIGGCVLLACEAAVLSAIRLWLLKRWRTS